MICAFIKESNIQITNRKQTAVTSAEVNKRRRPAETAIRLKASYFRYIKIQLEREFERTKTKESGCPSYSLQRVSIVFVLSASLSS